MITDIGAIEVSDSSARFVATIDPRNTPTGYVFQYGTTPALGSSTAPLDIGSGTKPITVSQLVSGLAKDTTYYYRVAATNLTATTTSPSHSFHTRAVPFPPSSPADCPNAAIRQAQGSTYLPDCRAYEMVSPPDKNQGGAVQGSGSLPVYSLDGNSAAFCTSAIFGDPPPQQTGACSFYLARRTGAAPTGWSTTSPFPPYCRNDRATGIQEGAQQVAFAADMGSAELEQSETAGCPYAQLVPGAPEPAQNVYRIDLGADPFHYDLLAPNPNGAVPQSTSAPTVTFRGGSEDFGHLVFDSRTNQSPDSPTPEDTFVRKLYDYHDGAAQLISRGPSGQPFTTSSAFWGHNAAPNLAAISVAGDRIYFANPVANASSPPGSPVTPGGCDAPGCDVYMREDDATTYDVSAANLDAPSVPSHSPAQFEWATPDGGVAFFSSCDALTAASTPFQPSHPDCAGDSLLKQGSSQTITEQAKLYRWDESLPAGHRLIDLSADNEPADGSLPAYKDLVAISTDSGAPADSNAAPGNTVFFVARGQLVSGQPTDPGLKLYRWTYDGGNQTLDYLGPYLSTQLASGVDNDPSSSLDLGVGETDPNLIAQQSHASANGRDLLISSRLRYDPAADHDSDLDLYRWDPSGGWTCVSCQAPGAPSAGDAVISPPLLTSFNPGGAAQAMNIAGERDYSLSPDGHRVVFTTPDALLPADVNGDAGCPATIFISGLGGHACDDVYEWNDGTLSLAQPRRRLRPLWRDRHHRRRRRLLLHRPALGRRRHRQRLRHLRRPHRRRLPRAAGPAADLSGGGLSRPRHRRPRRRRPRHAQLPGTRQPDPQPLPQGQGAPQRPLRRLPPPQKTPQTPSRAPPPPSRQPQAEGGAMSTHKRAAILTASILAAFALAGPAQALGAPTLKIASTHVLSTIPAGTYARYTLTVSNTGSTATSGDVTALFSLPVGLKVTSVTDQLAQSAANGQGAWNCTIAPDSQSLSCLGTQSTAGVPIKPGKEACSDLGLTCRLLIIVKADPDAAPTLASPTIKVSGGGAASPASALDRIPITAAPTYSLTGFDGGTFDALGNPATQAGSHPASASTDFTLSTQLVPFDNSQLSIELPTDDLKDAVVKLPPGLLGNPQATPTCTEDQIGAQSCPPESQVGTVNVSFIGTFSTPGNSTVQKYALYNMQPGPGHPALLAFETFGVVIQIYADLRSGSDYGATVSALNAPQSLTIGGVDVAAWGVPADPSHDPDRWCRINGFAGFGCPSPDAADPKPFLTLPTSCAGTGPNNSLQTFLDVTGWQGGEAAGSFFSHDNASPTPNPIGLDGCNALDFNPTLQARPTTNVADAPSGLDVDLQIPQNDDPNGNATAHLKDTTVTLPEGLTVNPAAANGLSACSSAQFGLATPVGTVPYHTTADPATCPDAAKLGTVEVDSPFVDHPVLGSVYIAKPFDNPFNSLLALYITIDDPGTGVVVKLAGKVSADPDTGQLSATFANNPQLPFEHFLLHFFGGAGGTLRTPPTCGNYTTTSSLTPWSAPDSGPPATPSDPWQIIQGPNGGACANSASEEPNTPDLDAGTVSPLANNYSPLVVNLRREDGSQNFSQVTLSPPPGLLGKLAGIPACSEAAIAQAISRNQPGDGATEQADPSCPAASQVGTLTAGAGAGPSPYYAQGTVYMAGPHDGAPLSFVILTPAVAGPFDLGVVVTRVALRIDPSTAQITAVADPIPALLQGIPLDVRSAQIRIDRDQFIHTGTSCDPSAFTGSLLSTLGQTAPLSERFQLAECSGLGFKPALKLSLKGGTKRNGHPAATIVLGERGGDANLGKAQITLPPSMQLDQSHIQAPCTRPQFAADQCPAASIIGTATATSPYVDYTLSGPVYLRTGSNPLPDVVLDLHGPPSQPLRFDVVNKIDTVNARLRASTQVLPDAPVSEAVISLAGGAKGLLVNNTNLCAQANVATVLLDGQNGKTADSTPTVSVAGCPKRHKKKHHKRHKRHHQRHHRRVVR